MNPEYCTVLCTCPDEACAHRVADHLVSNQLAACVNIVPGLTSVYVWKGQTEHSAELLLIIKTRSELFTRLETAIRELHPYELPEIIAVPITLGSAAYLDWIAQSTQARTSA
ncbi:MAG: divalent-cation tolerance protein CutA [Gammaproteobacteria bacterium]|nr:divalent-cation tolerance protein CutA [Gammaproteobacteria bacterium]